MRNRDVAAQGVRSFALPTPAPELAISAMRHPRFNTDLCHRWPGVFGDPKMTTAMLDRLTRHYGTIEPTNDSWRLSLYGGPHEAHARPAARYHRR